MDIQHDDALDLLPGVKAIADYLGQPESKTGYQIRKGEWPTFRIGKLVYARKSELRARASGQVSK
jgi:hypothetical protein